MQVKAKERSEGVPKKTSEGKRKVSNAKKRMPKAFLGFKDVGVKEIREKLGTLRKTPPVVGMYRNVG